MGFQPLIFNGFVIGQSSGGGGSSPSIGGPITGGIANSVLFVNPSATIDQDPSNFNYNISTHALTITGVFAASNFSGSSSGTNTGDVTLGTANGLAITGQSLSLGLSSTSTTGALSSTDWNTFNSKQPAGSYVTTSEVGAANGVASLDGGGKVPVGQLPSVVMEYEGAWNPNTNTPTLSDGTGTNGNVYYVTAQRSAAVSGNTDPSMVNFQIGDLVIYSSSVGKWQLVTPAAGVQSVNGNQGAVTVNAINQLTSDVTAGPASGSQSVSASIAAIQGTTVSGTTGTGNVVFSASPTITGTLNAGSAVFSSTISASNFTGSSSGTNTGDVSIGTGNGLSLMDQALSLGLSSTSTTGALSSTDWNTFNSKQTAGNYITALTGDVTASGPGSAAATIASTTVTGKLLTGFTAGPDSVILATDTVLQGLQKLQAQVSASPVASPGDINEMTFTAADNQSSPANITGLAFSNAVVTGAKILLTVVRNNTYATFDILIIQKASSWEMSQDFVGDTTGLTFSITTSGQVQYVSSSTGFTSTVKFRATTL